jgi:hypothetical protein
LQHNNRGIYSPGYTNKGFEMAIAPTVTPPLPIEFKRGSTFSFAMNVPATVATGYFRDWEVLSQVRRKGDTGAKGLIGVLAHRWADATTTRLLYVFDGLTEKWPIGPAEMDILFINGSGFKLRAKTVQLDIQRGITKWV